MPFDFWTEVGNDPFLFWCQAKFLMLFQIFELYLSFTNHKHPDFESF